MGDDPVNFHDPSGRTMCDAQYSYADCGGDTAFWGVGPGPNAGGFGNQHGWALQFGIYGGMSADIFQGLMNYLNNVDEAFAFASVSKNLPCEKEAVRNTIMGVAGNLGLDLSVYTVKSVGIAGQESEDLTELYLKVTEGVDPETAFAKLLNSSNFVTNFQFAGNDPIHPGYNLSYRQTTETWSMQISFNPATRNLQIDIDPHNPMRNFFAHAVDVIYNTITSTDTNYHVAAGQVHVADHPCP